MKSVPSNVLWNSCCQWDWAINNLVCQSVGNAQGGVGFMYGFFWLLSKIDRWNFSLFLISEMLLRKWQFFLETLICLAGFRGREILKLSRLIGLASFYCIILFVCLTVFFFLMYAWVWERICLSVYLKWDFYVLCQL